MIPLRQVFSSSVGKKLITALTGIGLVGFTISHLASNLALYASSPEPYNRFVAGLWSWGALVYVAEIGLLVLFLAHIVNGIFLKKNHLEARGDTNYKMIRSKGSKRSNWASRNMAISGIILLVFLVVHLWQFRFGPNVAEGYATTLDGKEARDLHRLVVEVFQNPWVVGFYVVSMLLFWQHLRHGIWSAFQSLGTMNARVTRGFYVFSFLLSLILAAGFLFIPIWLHFDLSGALR